MTSIEDRQRTAWAPVLALGLAMLVVTSEMTMAAITLPGIAADLGVDAAATAWVLLSYALPMAAVAIPAGRWADGADPRAVLMLSMAGVGVMSVLTAMAPWFWLLVAGRFVQGAAAALVVAAYMPIITASVRTEQRGQAIGFVMTVMTVGSLAGVPLGGLVAGAFGWREVFLIKLPLLVLVVVVALRGLRRDPERGLPLPGLAMLREALLLGGAVAALLLAVDEIDARPVLAGGLAVAAVALAVWWSRLAASRPVLTLVRTRPFAVPLMSLLATSFMGGLMAFLLPFFVERVVGGGPDLTGAALLFFVGAMAPLSFASGALVDRIGTRPVAIAGSAVGVVAMGLMLTLDADAGLVDLAWRLALLGVGAALFNAAINTAILQAAPKGSEGVAGGVSMTARTIAMTVGPAVAALSWTLAGGGTAGFRTGVLVLTVTAVLGLIALLVPTTRAARPRATSRAPRTAR